jgi:hypothetical protein
MDLTPSPKVASSAARSRPFRSGNTTSVRSRCTSPACSRNIFTASLAFPALSTRYPARDRTSQATSRTKASSSTSRMVRARSLDAKSACCNSSPRGTNGCCAFQSPSLDAAIVSKPADGRRVMSWPARSKVHRSCLGRGGMPFRDRLPPISGNLPSLLEITAAASVRSDRGRV